MLQALFDQINAIPRGLITGTMNLSDFIGQKLDVIADGLSGKNAMAPGAKGSVNDPFTGEHIAFLENARRTKPVNYQNLVTICTQLVGNPDTELRKKAIMEAFN